MNKAILVGRLTRDPEVRYSQGNNSMAIARYSLAVDRKFKREGEPSADFINCLAFGKTAEFAEKYFRQGVKIVICGHIQTGSYTNKDGVKVNTVEVVVDEQEFAESKSNGEAGSKDYRGSVPSPKATSKPSVESNPFMSIPDGLDEELPFN